MENHTEHFRNIHTFIQELSINITGIQDIKYSESNIVFPNLKHLHILEEMSSELFKDILKRCPKLQAVDIQMYNPTVCFLNLFYELNWKEIKNSYLYLAPDIIDNDLVSLIETNPNLEKLELKVNIRHVYLQLKDKTIRQIVNQLRNLKTLALRSCPVSSKEFTTCSFNFGLTELTIANCYLFDDNGIECVTRKTKNLLVLKILECNKITDKSIASIAENCPHLECLSIYHPHVKITNESLLAIANGCRNLKRLYWNFQSKNCNTMDSAVMAIANSCRYLVKISFDNNVDIGDLSLSSIATYCLFLHEASFSGCYGIIVKGVILFISSCTWLEKLDCSFCEGITDDEHSTVRTHIGTSKKPRISINENKSKKEDFDNRDDGCVQDYLAISFSDPLKECNFLRHIDNDQGASRFNVHSHLKYLSLKGCRFLSNVTILTLFDLCPDLREVDLIGTNKNIDQVFYEIIKPLCPFLNVRNILLKVEHI